MFHPYTFVIKVDMDDQVLFIYLHILYLPFNSSLCNFWRATSTPLFIFNSFILVYLSEAGLYTEENARQFCHTYLELLNNV